ncbi:MAG: DUF3891 family protein [Candidatus Binatia bacterium]
MVVRDRSDGSAIVSTQEDHAELSAQFAAHWGNRDFTKLRPYESMVFATTNHDSGYREWEGNPPMNLEKGRPYGHRENPPSFEQTELEAYVRNIEWVRSHDPYAALLVSMHRTGLWKNRYQVFSKPKGRLRERSEETKAVLKQLESKQEEEKNPLAGPIPSLRRNYGSITAYYRSTISFPYSSVLTATMNKTGLKKWISHPSP